MAVSWTQRQWKRKAKAVSHLVGQQPADVRRTGRASEERQRSDHLFIRVKTIFYISCEIKHYNIEHNARKTNPLFNGACGSGSRSQLFRKHLFLNPPDPFPVHARETKTMHSIQAATMRHVASQRGAYETQAMHAMSGKRL